MTENQNLYGFSPEDARPPASADVETLSAAGVDLESLSAVRGDLAVGPTDEDKILEALLATTSGRMNTLGNTYTAQRFRAERVRESSGLRALLSSVRSDDNTWGRVAGFLERSRKGDYLETSAAGQRNRVLSPLFAGIYTASPQKLEAALDAATRSDAEKLGSGQYWPTIVVGSGPTASVFVAQRRESKPGEAVLTIDDGERLGGQFAMARRPLFRLNSRNRPTTAESPSPLPGDKGNLNSLAPGVIEVPDLDSTIYPTQNVLATATALNTYLNSSLVSTKTQILGVLPNRNAGAQGRYAVFVQKDGEVLEVTTDSLVVACGLGKEKYKFSDKDTTELIEQERAAAEPRIMTYDDFLKVTGDPTKQFPLERFRGKRVAVVGAGDSANTVVETLLNLQVRAGDSVAQADQVDKIVWWGQDSTTKEELCNELRARYNLIALNAPRSSSSIDSGRIDIFADKTETIAENSDGFRLTGDGGNQDRADIVVLAKGYEAEIDTVLRSIAKPAEIEGQLINGNEIAQEQLAKSLEPGSLITFETPDGQTAFVELLPAADGGITERFIINGENKVSKTYSAEQREAALLQILACGRVIAVEGVIDRLVGNQGAVAFAESDSTANELLEFIRLEQAEGKTIYGVDNSNFALFQQGFGGSNTANQIRIQGRKTDFFAEFFVSALFDRVDIQDYLNGYSGSGRNCLISLPPAKNFDGVLNDELVALLSRGETKELKSYLAPGFGISFSLSGIRTTYIVTEVESGMVTYLDQDRSFSSNFLGEPQLYTVPATEFLEELANAYQNGSTANSQTCFRLPELTPELPKQQTITSGEAGYLYEAGLTAKKLRNFIAQEQSKGNTVILCDTVSDTITTFREPLDLKTDEVNLITQTYDNSDFFTEPDRYVTLDTAFGAYLRNKPGAIEDLVAISLPSPVELPLEDEERYETAFGTADLATLGPVLRPGFAVTFENNNDRRQTLFVVGRSGNTLQYISTEELGGINTVISQKVSTFVGNIQAELTEKGADNYDFSVRIPRPTPKKPKDSDLKVETAPKAKTGKPLRVPASRLNLTEVTGELVGEPAALAKSVFGEEVYVIGPAARLPLSDREQRRLSPLGINENAVAIFRYAPRSRRLAELLPARLATAAAVSTPVKRVVDIKAKDTKAKILAAFDDEDLKIRADNIKLPYDADLRELSSFAAVAALQGKVSASNPCAVRVTVGEDRGGTTFLFQTDGMVRKSTGEVAELLLDDPLFVTAFSKLSSYTPRGYNKTISFELTPNGVNPYTVTIQNTRD